MQLAEYSDITYDAAGRRTGYSAQIAALPDYSGSYTFTYNAKGELTGEEFIPDDQLLPPLAKDYSYTAAGNISDFNGTERRYNGANQLTQEWVNDQWVTVADYDGRGNPTEYRGHELEFNQGNHLTAFDETMTAGYSNDGRRIWKEVNGQRVFFIYDGDTLIGEVDEYGNPTAINTIGATGLVSRLQGGSIGTAVFYLFDPLGNVLHRLNGDGGIVSSDVYDAWGHREYSNDLTGDPYGYKGQFGYYTDHETGLILCTHRYYDPQTGRWLTKDPIGHEGGVNLYGYCANDAVNNIDSSGFGTVTIWGVTIEISDQSHHFLTNKHSIYSGLFKDIADRYQLDLNGEWNIEPMPHRGRHPNALWEFVLKGTRQADNEANGDTAQFLNRFEAYVKKPIREDPGMLREAYWRPSILSRLKSAGGKMKSGAGRLNGFCSVLSARPFYLVYLSKKLRKEGYNDDEIGWAINQQLSNFLLGGDELNFFRNDKGNIEIVIPPSQWAKLGGT